MTTDKDWRNWAHRDPYYAVLTDPRFRRDSLDSEALNAFFENGRLYGEHLLAQLQRHFEPCFAPKRVLDFGCGVGRVLLPWLELPSVEAATGIDVSSEMLALLQEHCPPQHRSKLTLVQSEFGPAAVKESFDLVHSSIVLQHIAEHRGRRFLGDLLDRVAPGGMAVIHCMYGRGDMPKCYGQPPWWRRPAGSVLGWCRRLHLTCASALTTKPRVDPVMEMHAYDVNATLYQLHQRGLGPVLFELVDHGAALGMVMYLHRSAP